MYILCILYYSLLLALYVSGAICTHPWEQNLSVQRVYAYLEKAELVIVSSGVELYFAWISGYVFTH
jgi:hypothetical protein